MIGRVLGWLRIKDGTRSGPSAVLRLYALPAGMTSYLANGDAIEIGIIGSEGIVGVPLILGADIAPAGAVQGNRVKPIKSFLRTAVTLWVMSPADLCFCRRVDRRSGYSAAGLLP
jgi:hypothetical protein